MKTNMKKWYIYYIGIVAFILLIVFCINFASYSMFRRQVKHMNEYLEYNTIEKIQEFFGNVNSAMLNVLSEEEFDSIYKIKDRREYYRSESILNLVTRLKSSQELLNIYEMYLYVDTEDIIISARGIFSSRDYFDIYLKGYAQTYEEWFGGLTQLDKGQKFCMYENSIQYSLLWNSAYGDTYQNMNVMLGIFFDKESIFLSVPNIDWISQCNFYVYDENNNLTIYDERKKILDFPQQPRIEHVMNLPAKYEIKTLEMNGFGYRYKVLLVFEKDLDVKNVRHVQALSIFAVFLNVAACLFILRYLYRTQFRPIQKIAGMLKIDIDKFDYKLLEKPIQNITGQDSAQKKIIEQQRDVIRRSVLEKILLNDIPEEYKSVLSNYGIDFAYENFVVIVASLYKMNGETDEAEFRSFSKCFEKSVQEILTDKTGMPYLISDKEKLICIYNTSIEQLAELQNVARELAYLSQVLKMDFDFTVSIAISNIHKGCAGIPTAYMESLAVITQSDMFNYSKIELYSDLKSSPRVNFSLKDENNLISAIKNGQTEEAQNFIDGVFEMIQTKNLLQHDRILISLINVLMKMADAVEVKGANINKLSGLVRIVGDTERVRSVCIEVIEELCKQTGRSKEKGEFVEYIKEYMEANYFDTTLSLDRLSDLVNYSAIYIGSMFRKRYGVTPMLYLSNYRIKKAKELIDKGTKIGDAAEKAGFSSVRTFNRVFQKTTGMSPVEYRNSNLKLKGSEYEDE